jgi:hypothetical protein
MAHAFVSSRRATFGDFLAEWITANPARVSLTPFLKFRRGDSTNFVQALQEVTYTLPSSTVTASISVCLELGRWLVEICNVGNGNFSPTLQLLSNATVERH